MNYSLMLSLERLALVKIASALWNQDYIRTLTTYYCSSNFRKPKKKWQKLEDKVTEKVSHLPLTECLKEEILAFIKTIGLQILKWMAYHVSADSLLHIDLPKEFCWTSQGTVDKKKTAEALIKDESLAVVDRFVLACIYCLENDIPKLWSNTPPHIRNELCWKLRLYPNVMHQKLVLFWIHKMGVVMVDDMNQEFGTDYRFLNQYYFLRAADSGNKEATEYFLSKLTFGERTESLVAIAASYAAKSTYFDFKTCVEENNADVLCFLLSRMGKEQQREVLNKHSDYVLELLLSWPWQSFFIETANLVWDFLDGSNYKYLLQQIVGRMKDGFKDYNYRELFGEFWQQSPNALKRKAIDECIYDEMDLLWDLYAINNNKNIKLILKDMTFIEKDNFDLICGFCIELIDKKKWDLLKFIIQECISSRNEMIRFKKEIISIAIDSGKHLERNEYKYNKFFQLLNGFICGFDKRKSGEDNGSPAKRQRTEFEEV